MLLAERIQASKFMVLDNFDRGAYSIISINNIHMFHIKLHSKRTVSHSAHWHENFAYSPVKKRVISKTHTKPYDPQALAESIHEACMKTLGFSGEAEATAIRVCKDLEHWLVNKEEVTVADIKRRAAAALRQYNPQAAYAYLPVKEYEVHEDQYGFVRL